MDFVLDNDVKQITMGALQQFNLDLIQCERKNFLSISSLQSKKFYFKN